MKLASVAISLFVASACHAQGAIGADAAVGSMVEQLRSTAQDVIHQLSQSASINSFQIRQHLLVTISELEHAALTIQDKTFKDLDKQQQNLFKGAENTIAEAKRAATASLAEANKIAKDVESAVARLPLAEKSPRITNIRPDHFLSPTTAAPVRIVVEGDLAPVNRIPC